MAKKKKPSKTKKKPAPTAPAPAKPHRGKQLKLPAEGMSRKTNPEIDAAAEAFRVARDDRMGRSKVEKAAKVNLLEVAKKHGVTVYVYESEDGEEFEVEYKSKQDEDIRVRKLKADDGEDE